MAKEKRFVVKVAEDWGNQDYEHSEDYIRKCFKSLTEAIDYVCKEIENVLNDNHKEIELEEDQYISEYKAYSYGKSLKSGLLFKRWAAVSTDWGNIYWVIETR